MVDNFIPPGGSSGKNGLKAFNFSFSGFFHAVLATGERCCVIGIRTGNLNNKYNFLNYSKIFLQRMAWDNPARIIPPGLQGTSLFLVLVLLVQQQ
jgi:hypothetical protein